MPRDPLHRLLLINALSGALIGMLFVFGLLWTDAYGLRSMILRDADGFIALLLLAGGCIVTSASVVAGTAVMMHGGSSDDDDDRGGGPGVHELQPVRVRARR